MTVFHGHYEGPMKKVIAHIKMLPWKAFLESREELQAVRKVPTIARMAQERRLLSYAWKFIHISQSDERTLFHTERD